MTTSWAYPLTVTQTAEFSDTDIEFYSSNGNLNVLSPDSSDHLRTLKNVLHLSNATAGDIRQQTYYLNCTGFDFDQIPNSITGIAVQLNVTRGRVLEKDVQLIYQGNVIGNSLVYYHQDIENHIAVIPNPIYGGDSELWGATITPAMLADRKSVV